MEGHDRAEEVNPAAESLSEDFAAFGINAPVDITSGATGATGATTSNPKGALLCGANGAQNVGPVSIGWQEQEGGQQRVQGDTHVSTKEVVEDGSGDKLLPPSEKEGDGEHQGVQDGVCAICLVGRCKLDPRLEISTRPPGFEDFIVNKLR